MKTLRFLGLDAGTVRIGLAIGDTETRIASPWGIVLAEPEERAFKEIQIIIERERIDQLVIGIPRYLRHPDRQTIQERIIAAWTGRLSEQIDIPTAFHDETLTTALAARWQHERQQKGKRDDFAAMAMLQSYLDQYPYEYLSS